MINNQLSNDELNRALHAAMGLIGHDVKLYNSRVEPYIKEEFYCTKCLSRRYSSDFNWPCDVELPNYCESLDAAAKVLDFTIERVGKPLFAGVVHRYVRASYLKERQDRFYFASEKLVVGCMTLSARQIAEVCFEALGLQEKNDANR